MYFCFKVIWLAFIGIISIVVGIYSVNSETIDKNQCSKGPILWCKNLQNAKACHAVRHCIQTVWEKQTVPEDNDSVCQICLDMVKQARDQLESNETQEDLKEVLEGSCALIPLKPIKKECDKLVDNFIPELIEALASQMNPQVVCSVAGLCNNAEIDKMLIELEKVTTTMKSITNKLIEIQTVPPSIIQEYKKKFSCSHCYSISSIISKKFHDFHENDIIFKLLQLCGRLSSYSDSCSNAIMSNSEDIYNYLNISINPDSICHMSGVCSEKYHKHPEVVEIRPLSSYGVQFKDDNIPCELCEQLIRHLKEVLIVNTTEIEFKKLLEGFCNQTKGFKSECLSIVDQYYDEIYNELVNNLNENGMCFMIGICPKSDLKLPQIDDSSLPFAPLLPSVVPQRIKVTIKENPIIINNINQNHKKLKEQPRLSNEEIQSMQLPIDRLIGAPHPEKLVGNGELCTLCEYFLRTMQEALSSPSNEEKIKNVVFNTCHKLPKEFAKNCDNFVDKFGDAIIALLIQEIDPKDICPKLSICPSVVDMEVFAPQPLDVKIHSKSFTTDKPTCPLCLFAVKQAQEMIKSDKSTANVKHVLDSLCSRLPKKLQTECVDFVETYSSELIRMLVTDFTADEICVNLKLCTNKNFKLNSVGLKIDYSDDLDIQTNEISELNGDGESFNPVYVKEVESGECLLCERIIKEVEKKIINPKSKEQIEHALEEACNKLHDKKLSGKCEDYIKKHGDLIVNLLMKELTRKMICRELGYCILNEFDFNSESFVKINIFALPYERVDITPFKRDFIDENLNNDAPCVICEFVMTKLEEELQNKTTQDDIKKTVKEICHKLPKTIANNCNTFINDYADLILNLLDSFPPKEICQKLYLCLKKKQFENIFNIEYELDKESEEEEKQTPQFQNFALKRIDDEIIDCGLCYGTTISILPLIKTSKSEINLDLQHVTDDVCENFEAKYYSKCSRLINYYGESIINLLKEGKNELDICTKIGKCSPNDNLKKSYMALQGINGVVTREALPETTTKKLLGENRCTWGPSYWCSDKSKAEECKAVKFCVEKFWGTKTKNN